MQDNNFFTQGYRQQRARIQWVLIVFAPLPFCKFGQCLPIFSPRLINMSYHGSTVSGAVVVLLCQKHRKIRLVYITE